MKVAVIGAGAAGLAATNALVKAGVDATTFEAAREAGGRARCYRKDGFTLDTGAQFMAKVCKTQTRLCHELGLGDQIMPFALKAAFWRDGKSYPLPAAGGIADMARGIPELLRFRGFPLKVYPQMARLGLALLKRFINVDIEQMNPECLIDLGDTSVAEFVLEHGGRKALDWVMAPLVTSLTLGEADEVSVLAHHRPDGPLRSAPAHGKGHRVAAGGAVSTVRRFGKALDSSQQGGHRAGCGEGRRDGRWLSRRGPRHLRHHSIDGEEVDARPAGDHSRAARDRQVQLHRARNARTRAAPAAERSASPTAGAPGSWEISRTSR